MAPAEQTSLLDLATLFLRLGATAFGGPAAHLAMMEDEVVRRRGWLTRDQFMDYVGATNLIPGPNSTELAIFVGHARAGWPGLIVAGASFIMPAALIVTAVAWGYVRAAGVPDVAGALYGVKPVVIAIVGQALWRLSRSVLRNGWLCVLGAAAVIAVIAGVHELLVLAACGAGNVLFSTARRSRRGSTGTMIVAAGLLAGAPVSTAAAATVGPVGLWTLFVFFARTGAVLFGSGYVLLAFLRADLVSRLGWLTEQQLLDAAAIGQVTPGPVFTTATFIGYLLGGAPGALVATVGIFLPAFIFVGIIGPFVSRLRQSPLAAALLDGVNVASLALMGFVLWQLAGAALVDPLTVVLAASSFLALVAFGVNTTWLVLAGAVAGALAVVL